MLSMFLVIIFSNSVAFAEIAQNTAKVTPQREQIAQIAFSSSWATTSTDTETNTGIALDAKFSTPASDSKKTTMGFSLRHMFSYERVQRDDLLAHVDYYFTPYLQAGISGGLQYIATEENDAAYLKALFGIQAGVRIASWSRFEWSESSLWLMTGVRQSAGSSGSLLLNNGTPDLKATTFTAGVYYTFAILNKQEE